MANTIKRKLTITGQEVLTTFTDKKGKAGTIYKVTAVSETGEIVDQELRTFDSDLPQGQLLEFEVTPYDHETYGRSYTIKLAHKGRASKKDIQELREQMEGLANRLSAVEEKLGELLKGAKKEQRPSGGEDDIPF